MTHRTLIATCLAVTLVTACRTVPILTPDAPLSPPASATLEDIGRAVVARPTGQAPAVPTSAQYPASRGALIDERETPSLIKGRRPH